MSITEEEAEELLRKDVNYFEEMVERELSKFSLSDNQFSALVSLCFNCGSAPIIGGTTIRMALSSNNYVRAADGILLWNKGAGSQVLPGLVRRRSAERALFMKSDGTITPSTKPVSVYILFLRDTFLKKKAIQSTQLKPTELTGAFKGNFIKADYLGSNNSHYLLGIGSKQLYVFSDHVAIIKESNLGV